MQRNKTQANQENQSTNLTTHLQHLAKKNAANTKMLQIAQTTMEMFLMGLQSGQFGILSSLHRSGHPPKIKTHKAECSIRTILLLNKSNS